jgi:hypothetical protein
MTRATASKSKSMSVGGGEEYRKPGRLVYQGIGISLVIRDEVEREGIGKSSGGKERRLALEQ